MVELSDKSLTRLLWELVTILLTSVKYWHIIVDACFTHETSRHIREGRLYMQNVYYNVMMVVAIINLILTIIRDSKK